MTVAHCKLVLAVRSLRLAQVRAFARMLMIVGRFSWGRSLIRWLRTHVLTRGATQRLLAFYGTFPNLEEARACAGRYIAASHDHPWQMHLHAKFAEATRESDYPVLFFLASIAAELRTVFDLGGSIGNLFFQLNHHFKFSPELVWMVHDLPFKKQAMLDFADGKGEKRLRFADDLSSASGVDLLIAVGSLHFFEQPLADLLCELDRLPKHVIVNRSPFYGEKDDIMIVQDGGLWLNPCKLHSVDKFVFGMCGLGYEPVASWPIHECRQGIPLYPEYSEPYKGFYFRLLKTQT